MGCSRWKNLSVRKGASSKIQLSCCRVPRPAVVDLIRFRNLLGRATALALFFGLVPLAAVHAQTQSGWNYDLSRQCVATTGSADDENYWADAAQCRRYTVVVENENTPQASCPGPANRSLPISKDGEGPIIVDQFPHESEIGPNFTVHQKVDFASWNNPCGPGYYAYLGFADMTEALPNPFLALASHLVSYGHWAPNGSVRLLAGIQGFWNNKAHILEVNLASVNWSRMSGLPPGVFGAQQ